MTQPPDSEDKSTDDTSTDAPPNSPKSDVSSPVDPAPAIAARELKRSDIDSAVVAANEAVATSSEAPRQFARRRTLPLVLFIATCLSTFWVGAAKYHPLESMSDWVLIRHTLQSNWQEGLTYMGAVLAILLTHEMGHFLQTVRNGIAASYPLCIPVPFNPIGTMGAVISMDGMKADRRQIFDIGIAGPLAGLVIAVPVLWIGVDQLDLSDPAQVGAREIQLNSPVIVTWMMDYLHPEWNDRADWIGISQVNPWFMAGWVGMLITGLNMLPISQLDGGHTLYGLFGERSRTYARAFLIAAIGYVVINLEQAAIWTPMLILVIIMGVDHPKTSNDKVELDDVRWIIGMASLSIPILCFPLLGLKQ